MFRKKIVSIALTCAMLSISISAINAQSKVDKSTTRVGNQKVIEPLNLAVLVQDDVISQVANEMDATRDFIRSLPAGSQVMVAYITAGSLQVRVPFTNDLNKAAKSLRIPTASASSAPFNPYVEVLEALRKFQSNADRANAILLISDGLDTSRGFDSTAAGHTLDLDRAITEANKRRVSVFSFYAPTVGLTNNSSLAASYGQSSLNRLSHETGGKAFFQGLNGFVTFDSYFERLKEALNTQYALK